MSTAERFLVVMTIILAAPYLIWRIGRLESVAPLVVVQIIFGVLLGPAWRAPGSPSCTAACSRTSMAGKLIGLRIAGRLLAWAPGEASLIGWLLQTKALIMIVFANVLLDRQIISAASFTALLLMAIGSTMLTMPMARPRVSRLSAGVFARG
jgi:K+:H+ antiporter